MNPDKLNQKNVNSSMQELVEEAKKIFSTFDAISTSICKMEKDLNDAKAFFSYSYVVKIEEDQFPKKPEPRHEQCSYSLLGYKINKHWTLSWEAEDNSKNFRLFLIAFEKEILYYEIPEDGSCKSLEAQSKIIFKKPLTQTDLQTRIQYSDQLIPFMNSFRLFLIKQRIAIENGSQN
jgi:hypothetical protein